MSTPIRPTVMHMILCDEVLREEQRSSKLTIAGLILVLRWPAGNTLPLPLNRLGTLLILTGGRGAGRGRIACLNEETGLPIFSSKELPIDFRGKDPVLPTGVMFTLRDCRFPTPGVYLVQFFFEDEVICQEALIVR